MVKHAFFPTKGKLVVRNINSAIGVIFVKDSAKDPSLVRQCHSSTKSKSYQPNIIIVY